MIAHADQIEDFDSAAADVEMKIGGLAPWFGAKRNPTLQQLILAEIGPHSLWCELFAGSCAITLAKPAARLEIVNDKYGPLVNAARVLASSRWPELHERLNRTLCAAALFIEARDRYKLPGPVAPSVAGVEDKHVEAAYWFMVFHWQGRAGFGGTKHYNYHAANRYTATGGGTARRFRSACESVPAWAQRLAAVEIKNQDALELAEKINDEPGAVIYADPPYIEKGAKYVHDLEDEQHARLAEILKSKHRARVIVSYYDHPRVRELYPPDWWTWVHVPITKGLNNQGARGRRTSDAKAPEVLIINGPSFTQAGGLFL